MENPQNALKTRRILLEINLAQLESGDLRASLAQRNREKSQGQRQLSAGLRRRVSLE